MGGALFSGKAGGAGGSAGAWVPGPFAILWSISHKASNSFLSTLGRADRERDRDSFVRSLEQELHELELLPPRDFLPCVRRREGEQRGERERRELRWRRLRELRRVERSRERLRECRERSLR